MLALPQAVWSCIQIRTWYEGKDTANDLEYRVKKLQRGLAEVPADSPLAIVIKDARELKAAMQQFLETRGQDPRSRHRVAAKANKLSSTTNEVTTRLSLDR